MPGNESWSWLRVANKSDRDNSECLFKPLARSRVRIGHCIEIVNTSCDTKASVCWSRSPATHCALSRTQGPEQEIKPEPPTTPPLPLIILSHLQLVPGLPWALLLVGPAWNISSGDTQEVSQLDSWVTIFGSTQFRGAAARLQAPPGGLDFSLQPWGRAHPMKRVCCGPIVSTTLSFFFVT